MTALLEEDPYFKARIQLLPEDVEISGEDFNAYTSTIKELANQIIQLSPNLPTEASIIFKEH